MTPQQQLRQIEAQEDQLSQLEAQVAALTSALAAKPHRIVVVAPWASLRKALVGFLGGFAPLLGTAIADGNLTVNELLAAVGAGIATFGAVYAVKNQQPEPGATATLPPVADTPDEQMPDPALAG